MDTIAQLIITVVANFGGLLGMAMLIAALVNLFKVVGLVKDGTSQNWYAGLSLLGMAALVFFRLYMPTFSLEYLDTQAGLIAGALGVIVGYVAQLGMGQWAHSQVLSGVAFVGRSFSAAKKK